MNQDEERPSGSEIRLDIRAAAERHSCSRNTIYNLIKKIYNLIKKGTLPSELIVVAGRDGRHVRKHLIKTEDPDAAFSTEAQGRHVAAIRAAAPTFTEEQKARLAVLLKSSTRR
ncbi:hypothetical protein [Microbacterium sp. cf332]|uniref:hypothetical protein n=1 Tax=Microbacterium sp. cf332 TaxID=1761804 RepID=UPI0008889A33|nr:hypothetical protein [Microbacterium sp. cf332]SDQ11735.1 hypothetical protein SAMN04487847_0438 [Microbacterium sp. cf332]